MKNLETRIAVPLALLLAANVAVTAWVTWHQLNEDVASSLESTALGLDRMLVAGLKESMRKNDRDHVQHTMEDFARVRWVKRARVFDMAGQIAFSGEPHERGRTLAKQAETCRGCHETTPPQSRQLAVIAPDDVKGEPILQAAEVIPAEADCVECHKVPRDRPLGVLVVDLDVGPLAQDVKARASRNLLVLLAGSTVLLVVLLWILRRLVGGRLVTLAQAIAALRAGKPLDLAAGSARDEIDSLRGTLAALGSDLEDRVFATDVGRRLELELAGAGASVVVLDAAGEVVLANDEAARALGLSPAGLAGKSYVDLGPTRPGLWERVRAAPLVFDPEAREARGPRGAERVLLALQGEGEAHPAAFLEVGRRRVEGEGEPAPAPPIAAAREAPAVAPALTVGDESDEGESSGAGEDDEAPAAPMLRFVPAARDEDEHEHEPEHEHEHEHEHASEAPRVVAAPALAPRHFLHHPYVAATPEGDRFLRALVILASLPIRGLPRAAKVLDFDPTLAAARRIAERLLVVRDAVDTEVEVVDLARIARSVAEDFRLLRGEATRWHLLLDWPASLVGHAVLLRQLLILLVERATAASPANVVVFVQQQRREPRFFLGVWIDRPVAEDPVTWDVCARIAERSGGKLELDPSYSLEALAAAHPQAPAELGRGSLLLLDLPLAPS